MTAETTLPFADEDEADRAWRYWREQFEALRATGDMIIHVRYEGGGFRRAELHINQQLQGGPKRRRG